MTINEIKAIFNNVLNDTNYDGFISSFEGGTSEESTQSKIYNLVKTLLDEDDVVAERILLFLNNVDINSITDIDNIINLLDAAIYEDTGFKIQNKERLKKVFVNLKTGSDLDQFKNITPHEFFDVMIDQFDGTITLPLIFTQEISYSILFYDYILNDKLSNTIGVNLLLNFDDIFTIYSYPVTPELFPFIYTNTVPQRVIFNITDYSEILNPSITQLNVLQKFNRAINEYYLESDKTTANLSISYYLPTESPIKSKSKTYNIEISHNFYNPDDELYFNPTVYYDFSVSPTNIISYDDLASQLDQTVQLTNVAIEYGTNIIDITDPSVLKVYMKFSPFIYYNINPINDKLAVKEIYENGYVTVENIDNITFKISYQPEIVDVLYKYKVDPFTLAVHGMLMQKGGIVKLVQFDTIITESINF